MIYVHVLVSGYSKLSLGKLGLREGHNFNFMPFFDYRYHDDNVY